MPRSLLLVLLAVLAGPVQSQPDARPNVLFIVSDDLNTDLGTYGHEQVQSPHLDRLAARGVQFDRAYVQYPVCNPSRSSFLTGLYPDQTGVTRNAHRLRENLPDVVTLPQWFRQHGYFAARVGKIFHYGVPGQIGTDGVDDPQSWDLVVNPRGVDKDVEDRIHTLEPGKFGGTISWLRVDGDVPHTDEVGAAEAVRLLEAHHPADTGQPFFLAVGFYRPHTPYVARGADFDRYDRAAIEPVMEPDDHRDDKPLAAFADRPKQRELTRAERQEIIEAYYASITLMDEQVGKLIDALDRLGLADNTIVVFMSDHGYHLGRHGLWQKGDLFEGSVQVPLLVAEPNASQAGAATDALVELVDLYPTLVDLAGLPEPDHLAGKSFAPVLRSPHQMHRAEAFSQAWSRAGWMHPSLGGIPIRGYSIRTPRYRYTEWAGGRHGAELYDYEADPTERRNLVGEAEAADVEGVLRRQLRARVQQAQPQPPRRP